VPTPEPTPAPTCPLDADLSNDNRVDIDDYTLLVRDFFTEGESIPSDINCDKIVDIDDYVVLIRGLTPL
jgi:hypothetical protein